MMRADVTRDVISDLWPLYRTGEASADSGRLIESFLARDAPFRAILEASEELADTMPETRLAPDAGLRLLTSARKRIFLRVLLTGAIIGLALFAIAVVIHALK